jgi:hypothetical protein
MQKRLRSEVPRQRVVDANSAHRSWSTCFGSTGRKHHCSTTGHQSPSISTMSAGHCDAGSSGGVDDCFAPVQALSSSRASSGERLTGTAAVSDVARASAAVAHSANPRVACRQGVAIGPEHFMTRRRLGRKAS